jgi:hypothetical protein
MFIKDDLWLLFEKTVRCKYESMKISKEGMNVFENAIAPTDFGRQRRYTGVFIRFDCERVVFARSQK